MSREAMSQPQIWGINHLKLAATDIIKTKDFYTSIMGLEYLHSYDHRNKGGELFAVVIKMKHNDSDLLIEIRHNEANAKAQKRWDPITFGVRRKSDLEVWKQWFEQSDVQCSRIFRGLIGWMSCAMDPDGKIVQLYCDEEHEWDPQNFDEDDFWLKK